MYVICPWIMYMFLVDDFRLEAYISLAYGEFFPSPSKYTPILSSWTNLVVLWSLVFGKSGNLPLVACLHLLPASSWSYLMYEVAQFRWCLHTMILWGQNGCHGVPFIAFWCPPQVDTSSGDSCFNLVSKLLVVKL
jgi:hypothetical protein